MKTKYGIEYKCKMFESVLVLIVLKFDGKIGEGNDVFETRNITILLINSGAPTMIFLEDV
ncbi:MAG: hypothetical protein LBP40_07960 [Campylobacteraceae bacterium]|jgi:hypothetical protein|nr:hypothetical protein [Campylobacteraceae bacterium]